MKQGMAAVFGGGADLSGMSTHEHLEISDVVHQAFIALDEDGTEAAAATAVIGVGTSLPITPPTKVVLTIDKPFVFFIRDDRTGTVLFTGRYVGG
jgi:serpin B